MPSIVLDDAGLQSAGGSVLPGSTGVVYAGWRIEARNAPITRDADMKAAEDRIGGARNLPEQLFGDSFLSLSHEGLGVEFRFDAISALRQWHSDNLAPLQVPHAKAWQQSRAADISANEVVTPQYDWTYTTSYNGSCTCKADGEKVSWKTAAKPMDKSLLLQRDAILFFADIPLYESEMDDNGASQLNAKIRVMPSCWYVLLRFWLRVDGMLVRMHDTRLLCAFREEEQPLVVREQMHCEGTYEELSNAGAPASRAAYASADSTAEVFQAVAPVGCKIFLTETLELSR